MHDSLALFGMVKDVNPPDSWCNLPSAACHPEEQEDVVPEICLSHKVTIQETADHAWSEDQESSLNKSESTSVVVAARVFHVSWTVRLGGALLACCAGIVNSVAFFTLGTFVSHTTGTLSRVGIGVKDPHRADAGDSLLLLLSFLIGSTVCGCIIAKNTIHFGLALYDFGLISVAFSLVAATFVDNPKLASCFASFACGLQNGLATNWGGAIIRTTHVTGLFTDVGLLLGRVSSIMLRKRFGQRFDSIDRVEVADDLSKLSVLITIAMAFFTGILIGSYLQSIMGKHALLVPAGITGSVGIIYSLYRVVILHQNLFSDAEMEVVDVPVEILDDSKRSSVGFIDKELVHSSPARDDGETFTKSIELQRVSEDMEVQRNRSKDTVVSVTRSSFLLAQRSASKDTIGSKKQSPDAELPINSSHKSKAEVPSR